MSVFVCSNTCFRGAGACTDHGKFAMVCVCVGAGGGGEANRQKKKSDNVFILVLNLSFRGN